MTAWMQDAACKGLPTSWWFADDGVNLDRARAICATCPVKDTCRRRKRAAA